MDNLHLFELFNAPASVSPVRLALALLVARGLIWLVPLGLAVVWVRAGDEVRRELSHLVVAAALAVVLAELVRLLFPHPRPSALHLGHHHLAHAGDSGLPSDQVTVTWALALAALWTHRLSVLCFPLLTGGLLLGLGRVYLGVNFPYDVLAAMPVALAGALGAQLLRCRLAPHVTRVIGFYHRGLQRLRTHFRSNAPH